MRNFPNYGNGSEIKERSESFGCGVYTSKVRSGINFNHKDDGV